MTAESVAIPILADGRPFIPATWIVEFPHIAAMVRRQSNFWTPAPLPLDGYVGPTPDDEAST